MSANKAQSAQVKSMVDGDFDYGADGNKVIGIIKKIVLFGSLLIAFSAPLLMRFGIMFSNSGRHYADSNETIRGGSLTWLMFSVIIFLIGFVLARRTWRERQSKKQWGAIAAAARAGADR